MTAPRILVDEEKIKRTYLPPAPDFGWQLIGVLGAVFVVLGLLDIALAWYPIHFGNPDWEFGTVASTLDSLPVTVMGFGLLLGAAVARGWRAGVRAWSIVFLVLAALILAIGVVYLLNVPVGFRTINDPVIRSGFKKAVAKAVGQMVLYPIGFAIMALKGLKFSKGTR